MSRASRRSAAAVLGALAGWAFSVSGGGPARAESPAGSTYTLSLEAPHAIVLPASLQPADAACDEPSGTGAEPLCIDLASDFATAVDAAGKIGGDGALAIEISGEGLSLAGTLAGTVTGTIKSSARGRAVRLRFKLGGTLLFGGFFEIPASASGTVVGTASDDGLFTGTQKIQLHAPEAGSLRLPIEFTQELDAVPWELQLEVTDLGKNALGGTAHADVDGAHAYDFAIRGKYDAKKDTSVLTLRPDPAAKGITLKLQKLVISGGEVSGGQLRYKLAGQSGTAELAP
jgi:hypothetical protein